jgi:hypothetical protein
MLGPIKEHHSDYTQLLLWEEETLVPLSPTSNITAPNTHAQACTHVLQVLTPNLVVHLMIRLSPIIMATAAALIFLNIHRQEQPPIAQRAFMSGPFV